MTHNNTNQQQNYNNTQQIQQTNQQQNHNNQQQIQQINITIKQQKFTKYINTQNNTRNNNSQNHLNTKKLNNNQKNKNYIMYAKWNCRKGILTSDNQPRDKIIELEDYINSNEIYVLTINEADLHGHNSRVIRSTPIDDDTIDMNLNIEGFKLWMPTQWSKHNQARTIMYTREEIAATRVKINNNYDDLPMIILDIGQPGAKKTRVCGFYREYKGSVSGLDSKELNLRDLIGS